MDKIIDELRYPPEVVAPEALRKAVRRLEECRALLERLARGEPAPEGTTFQSWAGDLLR